ncbi:MAG: ABC transporter transmembrane domain-containing protein [Candidatus Aminicenantes bacterium]|jgi:subfamily B ATP-binding cassette protein MsbA
MKEIFELFGLALKEKKRLIFSFIFTLFVAFFTFVFVDLVQPIIDNMFQVAPQAAARKTSFLMDFVLDIFRVTQDQLEYFIPVLLVIVIFGKGLFTFLSSYLMKSVGFKAVKNLRNDLFEHLIYQSSNYYDSTATGKLMTRLTSDVDKVQEAVSGSMKDFIQEALILIALVVFIFYKDWSLALASFVIAPLAVVPLAVFSKYLKKRGRQNQVRMSHIFDLLHETITGNRIVKAFTMEKFELKKFFQATKDYLRTSMKLAWVGSLSSPFMEFLGAVVGAFILIIGASRIAEGAISAGGFSAFVVAIFYSYTPIKRLSRANVVVQQGLASFERIKEVLQTQPQIQDRTNAYPIPPIKGEVKFDHVSFCYNEAAPVLHDVNFEVHSTELAALVGLSGSGKTTIINLLSRFYEPTGGRILVDGIDIREVTLKSLRSQLGLVTQELILFNDTVRNNIAYGLEEMPMDKIIATAKAAKAHDFITALPKGYETVIGEKGGLLSSGQRQRLAIARALLKDPPILILDEATSALDSESERLIQAALANILKNRTAIVIAHRLSTIRNADKILVIDRGKIVETGTHQQLMQKDGMYKKLHELQFP